MTEMCCYKKRIKKTTGSHSPKTNKEVYSNNLTPCQHDFVFCFEQMTSPFFDMEVYVSKTTPHSHKN